MFPGHEADQICHLQTSIQIIISDNLALQNPLALLVLFLFFLFFQVPPEKEAFSFIGLLFASPLCLSAEALQ